MIVLPLASVLVSLLSFGAAAPAADDCSQLTQLLTVNELHQILGKWILIEGFSNNELFDSVLGAMESVLIMLNSTAHNDTLLLDQVNRLVPRQHQTTEKGQCLRMAKNVTLVDGKALEFYLDVSVSYHRFLKTCPDCLLMHTYHKVNSYQLLYLFGRNTTLSESDLKITRKQAACLQFPPSAKFHYDANKELCPL